MPHSRTARRFATILLVFMAFASGHLLAQQNFPTRPLRLVVPAPSGGATDILARAVAQGMQKAGVTVVVENRAGASGAIGVMNVVQSAPDGHSMLFTVADAISIYPYVNAKLSYRPYRDLMPFAQAASSPGVYLINSKLPARTVGEFLELAGKSDLNYSSAGTGTAGHLLMEMFADATKAKLTHIPYIGAAPSVKAAAAGEVAIVATSVQGAKSYVDAGLLRALASTGRSRLAANSDIPTMAESGFAGFDVTVWFGIFAPAGTPPAVADKLNAMVNDAIRAPEYQALVDRISMKAQPMNRQDFAQDVKDQSAKWESLVKRVGIKVNE